MLVDKKEQLLKIGRKIAECERIIDIMEVIKDIASGKTPNARVQVFNTSYGNAEFEFLNDMEKILERDLKRRLTEMSQLSLVLGEQ